MKAAFHTLGCKVNHYETEAVKEAFVSRGAEIVKEDEPADVYIVNTCTVTNIADRKSRQYIRRMKAVSPDALVVVTGCYAQVAADEIEQMPEVDMVVGNGLKSEICGLVLAEIDRRQAKKTADTKTQKRLLPRAELTYYEDLGRISSASGEMARAYVKIQDGCDRFCSYCLIPYARGPVRSRPKDDILEEIRGMLGNGFREIVLTGINTALYGTEEGAECSLSELLTEIDEMDCPDGQEFRVRLSSLEPTVVDKDNVAAVIRHRRLCRHLHLSVQSGSSRVLAAMNRRYTREEYLEIVQAIREYDPLYGITTDIIVGFPGESEADFAESLDIVKRSGFGRVHVFRYSPRRGTAGAKLRDPVPEESKKRRSAELEKQGEETARAFIEANRGRTHQVLIEEETNGYLTGYTGNYIKVYIPAGDDRPAQGSFCDVVIGDPFEDGAHAAFV